MISTVRRLHAENSARLTAIETELVSVRDEIKDLNATINQARGGFKLLMILGTGLGVILTALASWGFLKHP